MKTTSVKLPRGAAKFVRMWKRAKRNAYEATSRQDFENANVYHQIAKGDASRTMHILAGEKW